MSKQSNEVVGKMRDGYVDVIVFYGHCQHSKIGSDAILVALTFFYTKQFNKKRKRGNSRNNKVI